MNNSNNMRNLVGFNTPSKVLAQEQMSSQSQVQEMQMPTTNLEMLKMESIQRANELGNLITTPAFNVYNQEQRAKILMDFNYYTKVAESL